MALETETKASDKDLTIRMDFKCKNVDFEDAVEQTGFGKYHILLILICGMAMFSVNTEAFSVGFILPSTECEWQLDTSKKGILTSANVIGIMSTCMFWGYLSDLKGRRQLMMYSFAMAFISSIASAFIKNFWGFVVLRLINGICISGPSAVTFAYFGEFQGNSQRSKTISYMSLLIAAALINMPFLGWLILTHTFEYNLWFFTITPWRLYMLINAIPSLIATIGLTQLPESPKFLYSIGDLPASLDILKKIYSVNTGEPKESFPVESLDDKHLYEKKTDGPTGLQQMWSQIVPLFTPPHLIYTLAGCTMMAIVSAISSGLFLWYPDIINQLSNVAATGNQSLTICAALAQSKDMNNADGHDSCNMTIGDDIFIQNIIIGFAYLVGYSAWGVVVNALGNKNFFSICMIVSSIGTVVICLITNKLAIDVLFVVILMLPGITVAVISAIMVNIIPTHLCGMAICISMTAARLGSIVSSSVVGAMLEWNCTVTFMLYAAEIGRAHV